MKDSGETSRSYGTFWPLETAEDKVEDERTPGTLQVSPAGVELELESSRLTRLLLARDDLAEPYRRCMVGALGSGSYVRLEKLQHVSWGSHSIRPAAIRRFRLLGDLVRSPHESVLSDAQIALSELHVEMDRLSDWFTSLLEVPNEFDGELLFLLQLAPPPEVTFRKNGEDSHRVILRDDLELVIENRLYSRRRARSECVVEHATVAVFRGQHGTVPLAAHLDYAERLRAFIELLSGEDCRIKHRVGRNLERTLGVPGRESREHAPYSVHTNYEKQDRSTDLDELAIHWRDLNGFREQDVLRQWFLQYPQLRTATRMLARSTPGRGDSESAEGGIILMVGAIQELMRCSGAKEKERYERFLENIGMKDWGLDIGSWGKRISAVRNVGPAHGWEWTDHVEVRAVYRFLLAALRLGILARLGLTPDQLRRIAGRHRNMRAGLGLESLPNDEYEMSGKPGWIVKGETA